MSGDILSFGEILWDLLPDGPQLGGAPFNLAYRLDSLGEPTSMISRLGQDSFGNTAFQRMVDLQMDTRFIQWDSIHPTGTVNIDLSNPNHPEYEIIQNVAYDYIEPSTKLLEAAKQSTCICFGTLNQRETTARNTLDQMLNIAQSAIKVLDINLRKKCYTPEILEASLQKATVLKINESEALELDTLFALQTRTFEDFCRKAMHRWNLSVCLMTLGEQGAFAMAQDEERTYEPGYRVSLNDPCGAGDAFTAGFLLHWLQGHDLHTGCRYGNALGALVATQSGATTPITREQIEAFLDTPHERIPHPAFL